MKKKVVSSWKCPLCSVKIALSAAKKHVDAHIEHAYEKESEWFNFGEEARRLYEKLDEKEKNYD